MARLEENPINEMEFIFESDAAASFLVIKCDMKVLEYQALMLERNCIRNVISVNIIIKEGITCFYYNITSKTSLSLFLSRRKLNREEFLKLLLYITSAVKDSTGYLLTDTNFIFKPDYIYISPETLEPDLIYVPASLDEHAGITIQGFISDLMLLHINVAGFGSGNFVQRILSSVKSEIFNIKGLISLLSELLYGQEPDKCETPDKRDRGPIGSITGGRQDRLTREKIKKEENRGKKNITEEKLQELKTVLNSFPNVKAAENKGADGIAATGRNSPWISALAIMVQIVIGGVIYLGRGFLNNIGENPNATYAAVAMIVLAIEVLIFKKLNSARLIHLETEQENNMAVGELQVEDQKDILDKRSVPEMVYADASHELSRVDSELAEIPANTTNRAACKTELLSSYKKGERLLKSTRKQSCDEDIFIDKDDMIIGRLTGHVDHVLNNNAVGKLHVQLTCRDGICYVKDLNSMNGTFINNKRIESNKEFILKENDRLQLANSEFIFIAG